MVAIVLIPNDLKDAAESVVKQLAPTSEGPSFTVALRPSSSTEMFATHWACLPIVSAETEARIQQVVSSPPFAGRGTMRGCDPIDSYSTFLSMCAALNLEQISLEE